MSWARRRAAQGLAAALGFAAGCAGRHGLVDLAHAPLGQARPDVEQALVSLCCAAPPPPR